MKAPGLAFSSSAASCSGGREMRRMGNGSSASRGGPSGSAALARQISPPTRRIVRTDLLTSRVSFATGSPSPDSLEVLAHTPEFGIEPVRVGTVEVDDRELAQLRERLLRPNLPDHD